MLNFTLYDTINDTARWLHRCDDHSVKTLIVNMEGQPTEARVWEVAQAAGAYRKTPLPITITEAEEIARVVNTAAGVMGVSAPDLLAVCTWKSLHDAITTHRGAVGGWEVGAVRAAIRRWRHTDALWTVIDRTDSPSRWAVDAA